MYLYKGIFQFFQINNCYESSDNIEREQLSLIDLIYVFNLLLWTKLANALGRTEKKKVKSPMFSCIFSPSFIINSNGGRIASTIEK